MMQRPVAEPLDGVEWGLMIGFSVVIVMAFVWVTLAVVWSLRGV